MGVFDWTGGGDTWDFGDTGDFWGSFGDSGTLGGSGGSVFDYTGGDWGDGGGSFFDFNSGGGDSSSSSWLAKFFGGSGSGGSGSSGSSGIFGALLSGLGGAADNYQKGILNKETAEEMGLQQRKTSGFQADLIDYYKQKDKVRKRTALDTYGQFSTMNRWAPNARPAAPIDMPAKPVAGK